jgi:hypothetical protein
MAQAMRAILLASAMAATFVGRRANNAVSQPMPGSVNLGVTDDGECTGHEQAAQIAVTSLWKSCFAETIDEHLSPLSTTSYHFRYTEMRFILKELGHRLLSFCISP